MTTTRANLPAAAGAIEPKLIVPFINAIRTVLATMVRVEAVLQRPQIKRTPATTYDVSSVIGFSGEVVGSMVVSLRREAAMNLVAAFAGMPIEFGSADFADAIGELANMIAGGAKRCMGRMASLTLPSVIIGGGHTIARLSDVPCVILPCTTLIGDFAVEVTIKQAAAQT